MTFSSYVFIYLLTPFLLFFSNNGSFESSLTLDMQNLAAAAANDLIDDETIEASGPSKRLKVSDINISRYEEEFLKIREIASGTFGTVSVARHRLDGMVYAIKVSSWKYISLS